MTSLRASPSRDGAERLVPPGEGPGVRPRRAAARQPEPDLPRVGVALLVLLGAQPAPADCGRRRVPPRGGCVPGSIVPADATVLPPDRILAADRVPPVTVSCVAPAHWANLVRFQEDAIAALFGATSVTMDGREVIAAFDDEAAARGSPAADRPRPAARRRRRSSTRPRATGSRGSAASTHSSRWPSRGMYVANLDWKNSRLTVVGDASVFAGIHRPRSLRGSA